MKIDFISYKQADLTTGLTLHPGLGYNSFLAESDCDPPKNDPRTEKSSQPIRPYIHGSYKRAALYYLY